MIHSDNEENYDDSQRPYKQKSDEYVYNYVTTMLLFNQNSCM
jgi:hypothetical protein